MEEYYITGLCGAHGTGKSTIIQAVKDKGFQVDESQLSRTAQKMLGWEWLGEAGKSEENMWALQDAILQAMYDRDERINASKIPTLVDRTPADVWGYLAMWIKKFDGKVDYERVQFYKQQCRVMAAKYYRHIIVPIRDEIPFVAEASRAELDTRDFHAKEVEEFVVGGGLDHAILQTVHIDYRTIEVVERMRRLE